MLYHLSPRLQSETGLGAIRLTPAALDLLASQSWPGNIRQLHATLARALIDSAGMRVDVKHLPSDATQDGSRPELERRMIEIALRSSGGVIAYAARRIGWSRQKLYRRIRVLGITARREGIIGVSQARSDESPA